MAEPMRIRAVLMSDRVDREILVSQVMETGQRQHVCWGALVSISPRLAIAFKSAAQGDALDLSRASAGSAAGDGRRDAVVIA